MGLLDKLKVEPLALMPAQAAPAPPIKDELYPPINRYCILPKCGIPIKRPGASFCFGHYYALPEQIRNVMKKRGMDSLPLALEYLFNGAPTIKSTPAPERPPVKK